MSSLKIEAIFFIVSILFTCRISTPLEKPAVGIFIEYFAILSNLEVSKLFIFL